MTSLWTGILQVSLFLFFLDDDQEGVLDGLMEALNTGSAFRDPSRPARKKAPGGKKGEITDVTQSATLHANRHAIGSFALSLLHRLKGLISLSHKSHQQD